MTNKLMNRKDGLLVLMVTFVLILIASGRIAAQDCPLLELKMYGQQQHASDIDQEPFDTLASWLNSSTDTANVDIVDPTIANPDVGYAMDLTTGSHLGAVARVQRNVGSIPSAFSIGFMSKLNAVGDAGASALHIDIQNVNNKELKIRQRDFAFEFFQDGHWQFAHNEGGTIFQKWWVEVLDQGDGEHCVEVYLNGEFKFSRVGELPNATGNNGLAVVYQESGHANYRHSQVAYLNVGTTQLPSLDLVELMSKWGSTPPEDINATASSYAIYDSPRTGYGPDRADRKTVAEERFEDLSNWVNSSLHSGEAAIVDPMDPNPPIGKVLDLKTGSELGSIARVQRDLGSVPSTFSVGFHSSLNQVGFDGASALHIDITNIDNRVLRIRQRDEAFEVFVDGHWHPMITHGGNYFTEWWVEVIDLGGAPHQHTIELYAGTEFLGPGGNSSGPITGELPQGTGVSGKAVIYLESGSANDRHAQIANIDIGISQLPRDMSVVSMPIKDVGYDPLKVGIVVLVEDVALGTDINVNLVVQLSRGGEIWETVSMELAEECDGIYSMGEVDNAKPIYVFHGKQIIYATGSDQLIWRVKASDGVWQFLQGVHVEWNQYP